VAELDEYGCAGDTVDPIADERSAVSKGVFDTTSAFKVEKKKEGSVGSAVYRYFFGQV
jgi:hypothetical protein